MISMTLAEVADAVGGSLSDVADPQARVTGAVVVDSRQVEPGGLFVAIAGERVDGHEFAAAACAAGAVAVVAARPVGVPAIVVDDQVAALAALAQAVAQRLPATAIVGITGSAGKTGTKDVLAQLLSAVGPTVAPPESFNNEIGFPLTVLRADADTSCLVLEMGAKGVGHVAQLCAIAPPRVGVVLNVGTAHIGEFGGQQAIAAAKGELVEALPAGGLAVLNADDELVSAMAARTNARVVRFGRSADADVRADDVTLDQAARPSFTLVTSEGTTLVRLRLHGEHQVYAALAAAAVGLELGLGTAEVAARLAAAERVSRHRMEVTERADGVTIVNDAYNANPPAMLAALRSLVAMAGQRRKVAVLGEMLELGDAAPEEHRNVGTAAAELGADLVIAVGAGAAAVAEGARTVPGWHGRAVEVNDGDTAEKLLDAELRRGDVVIFKSSRDAGLRWIGDRLATRSSS
ncbi:MAG: UDP-N-acetylmuramoyl-tripeptide--D-alanyl-D-alanine ligase [Streptosporangiales bacterium]|nr:UDP-N-acetylmuramoyl-tripeptide--D-alanyl-D-alanine ligase [Streptosporangiales bacterium]